MSAPQLQTSDQQTAICARAIDNTLANHNRISTLYTGFVNRVLCCLLIANTLEWPKLLGWLAEAGKILLILLASIHECACVCSDSIADCATVGCCRLDEAVLVARCHSIELCSSYWFVLSCI